ncbi:uncharacterized protein [Temnothorax nylanderi]|uniref:uncharacterized protein n=1 Tax=Temnothorax nylanderi TaxID=102681 RepID=UPI003A85CB21
MKFTCVNDLLQNAKINFAGRKPNNVYLRLPAMRINSDLAKERGDDETAYIELKKWLDTVEWLWTKRTRDEDGKLVYSYATDITVDQINEVKNVLADMKQKLEVRYELESTKRNTSEIPTEESLYIRLCSDSDQFISCNQLFYLIRKRGARFLIIDTRPKADYESSKILSKRCINIPQSEIKKGLMGRSFVKCFLKDMNALELYVNRSEHDIDILVLLDWNATQETLAQCVHVNILKEIFEKSDPGVMHNKIKILNGGYQEWMELYSAFTTNPNIRIPKINNIENEILETFEYPDDIVSPNKSKNFVTITKRKSQTQLDSPESPVLSQPKIRRANEVLQNVSQNPIDHSKPVTLKTSQEVLRFLKKLNELAKSREKLANELYCQECQLYSQREDKYSASDENYRRADDMNKMYLKIENEYKRYLNEAGTINYNATEEFEKRSLELSLSYLKRIIENFETGRKKLQEVDDKSHQEKLKKHDVAVQQLEKQMEELLQQLQPQQLEKQMEELLQQLQPQLQQQEQQQQEQQKQQQQEQQQQQPQQQQHQQQPPPQPQQSSAPPVMSPQQPTTTAASAAAVAAVVASANATATSAPPNMPPVSAPGSMSIQHNPHQQAMLPNAHPMPPHQSAQGTQSTQVLPPQGPVANPHTSQMMPTPYPAPAGHCEDELQQQQHQQQPPPQPQQSSAPPVMSPQQPTTTAAAAAAVAAVVASANATATSAPPNMPPVSAPGSMNIQHNPHQQAMLPNAHPMPPHQSAQGTQSTQVLPPQGPVANPHTSQMMPTPYPAPAGHCEDELQQQQHQQQPPPQPQQSSAPPVMSPQQPTTTAAAAAAVAAVVASANATATSAPPNMPPVSAPGSMNIQHNPHQQAMLPNAHPMPPHQSAQGTQSTQVLPPQGPVANPHTSQMMPTPYPAPAGHCEDELQQQQHQQQPPPQPQQSSAPPVMSPQQPTTTAASAAAVAAVVASANATATSAPPNMPPVSAPGSMSIQHNPHQQAMLPNAHPMPPHQSAQGTQSTQVLPPQGPVANPHTPQMMPPNQAYGQQYQSGPGPQQPQNVPLAPRPPHPSYSYSQQQPYHQPYPQSPYYPYYPYYQQPYSQYSPHPMGRPHGHGPHSPHSPHYHPQSPHTVAPENNVGANVAGGATAAVASAPAPDTNNTTPYPAPAGHYEDELQQQQQQQKDHPRRRASAGRSRARWHNRRA